VTETFEWYLGIDWGNEAHQLCLVDASGRVCGERVVPHTVAAVHDAVQWVRAQAGAPPAAIAVGIETPRGALVDTVIEQGFPVFALNPKQLDRFRDRFSAAGAKDDQRDAHVLADALRTDRRAFRLVRPDDPLLIQLRELARLRDDLQEEETRLTNRLRDQPRGGRALAMGPPGGDARSAGLGAITPPPRRRGVAHPPHSARHRR
jgi:transposase